MTKRSRHWLYLGLLGAIVIATVGLVLQRTWRWMCTPIEPPVADVVTLRGHLSEIYDLAYSPTGDRLATTGLDKMVKLWDAHSGEELGTFHGHKKEGLCVAFDPKGAMLASGDYSGVIRIWDIPTGKELHLLDHHKYGVTSLSFSPDGKLLASGSKDGTVRLWDVATGQESAMIMALHAEKGHDVEVVRFSPSGSTLALGGWRGLKLWNVEQNQEQPGFKATAPGTTALDFSHDGKRIAVAMGDRYVVVVDAMTGQQLQEFAGHDMANEWSHTLAFSPDGSIVASGSRSDESRRGLRHTYAEIMLWDSATAKELAMERTPGDLARALRFSPTGEFLAIAIRNKVHVQRVTDIIARCARRPVGD